jgi:hypothetical protein
MLRGETGDDRRYLHGEEVRTVPGSVFVVAQDVPELAVQLV